MIKAVLDGLATGHKGLATYAFRHSRFSLVLVRYILSCFTLTFCQKAIIKLLNIALLRLVELRYASIVQNHAIYKAYQLMHQKNNKT
mgnify:CR=1 FL=1